MWDLEIIGLVCSAVEIGYLVFGIFYINLVVGMVDWMLDVFLLE